MILIVLFFSLFNIQPVLPIKRFPIISGAEGSQCPASHYAADAGQSLSLLPCSQGASRTWPVGQSFQASETQVWPKRKGWLGLIWGQQCPSVGLARATSWSALFLTLCSPYSLLRFTSIFHALPSHCPIWLYDLPINLPNISICLWCPEQAALACNKNPNWYNYWPITEQFLAVIKKWRGKQNDKLSSEFEPHSDIYVLSNGGTRGKSSGLWAKRSWVQDLTLPFTRWPWVKHLISKNLHFLTYSTRINPSQRYVLRTMGDYFYH